MITFDTLDAFEKATGSHLGYSDWISISQHDINAFADATGDHQWIHVDTDAAAQGPFGTTIAHGYLTVALIPRLTSSIFSIDGLTMGVNYGLNKVRFPSVVPAGSEIRAGAELLTVTPTPNGTQAVIRVIVELAGSDKPVCVADTVTLFA
ncbi:MaoC family dehydratase [Gordonia rubripertincta]|uniref:MaoC family dehydratase n=1 Tax=Gordonia rubripertincta TaxID=36822 RepID=A0ABT4MVN5_GORRU|nr:MaoC family dehydratase [Gordonia rubripertincta]MCZ4551073.1 MaoC family dehydratase [Gordonia rubripertincta]